MQFFKLAILTMFSFSLVSCGGSGKQFVSNLNVQTVDQDQDKWLVTDFQLNLGKVELPELAFPLPSDYGTFRSYRQNNGNYLGIDLNVTSITNLPGGIASLPNGQVVPVETGGAGIIEIPINSINGKAYIAISDGIAILGLAVVIKQLDDLDLEVGDVGVFPQYTVAGVDVMAGIFTSSESKQSGIAIFANVASIWNKNFETYDSEFMVFQPEYVKKKKKRRIMRKLRKMLKKRMTLDFVER